MKSIRPLIIFTHYYPFGCMELFLETEIRYLCQAFNRIIVVPNVISGPLRELPVGVQVETSFALSSLGNDFLSLIKKGIRALAYPSFYCEMSKIPKTKAHIRRLLAYSYEASRCAKWFGEYLIANPELQEAIVYTYWFYDHTTGVADLKTRYPKLSIVSRAHGFDLYEEDYSPGYIPYRQYSLERLDKLLCISNHGLKYIADHYPEAFKKAHVSRLGIEDPGCDLEFSADSPFTIVSCGHLIPLKRLDLLINGIEAFARLQPEISIRWVHIGDGPLKDPLRAHALEKLGPLSIKHDWLGNLPNQQVFEIYRELKPHVFLLTSETEGIPVSIMEAYACGIPAIATSVGGVAEIVNEGNGILLPPHVTPHQIGQALQEFWLSTEKAKQMKKEARRSWESHFQANKNYSRFAKLIDVQNLKS